MLSQTMVNSITQKRMDALSAKYLHEYRLAFLKRSLRILDLLTIAVPVFYSAIRYLAKGTTAGSFVESNWEIITALLLILTIIRFIFGLQDRAEKHSKLIGENISLASQADWLLNRAAITTNDSAQIFMMLADNLEKADREALGELKKEDKQRAFREALKEFKPGSTEVCPECEASPWQYSPGACQVCGNTPAKESKTVIFRKRSTS